MDDCLFTTDPDSARAAFKACWDVVTGTTPDVALYALTLGFFLGLLLYLFISLWRRAFR